MARFTDKNEIKLFEKDEREDESHDEEPHEEEHHAHFPQKEKWKRPKSGFNCYRFGLSKSRRSPSIYNLRSV